MATKKQLQTQADEAGVEYDPKATKSDIEAALADAGVEVSGGVPSVHWFKNVDTGVVFATRAGSPTHKRVTSARNRSRYSPTSNPKKG